MAKLDELLGKEKINKKIYELAKVKDEEQDYTWY